MKNAMTTILLIAGAVGLLLAAGPATQPASKPATRPYRMEFQYDPKAGPGDPVAALERAVVESNLNCITLRGYFVICRAGRIWGTDLSAQRAILPAEWDPNYRAWWHHGARVIETYVAGRLVRGGPYQAPTDCSWVEVTPPDRVKFLPLIVRGRATTEPTRR